jgi:hypothetical protein
MLVVARANLVAVEFEFLPHPVLVGVIFIIGVILRVAVLQAQRRISGAPKWSVGQSLHFDRSPPATDPTPPSAPQPPARDPSPG